ncbi:MAG: 3-(3-hydroxy-phenyl)propionate transporter MhpT, partial [Caulobacterales bacterium]
AGLLERRRRGWILGVWYVAMAACLIVLARTGPSLAQAGTAGFVAGFFISSAPLILYAMAPNYYPVIIRGAGVGATVAVGRVGAIVGPLLAAALLTAGAGAERVLLAVLPLVALAAAATLALLTRPTVAD